MTKSKDLLKFATEHGYHDSEGMDNSPSWMSQELDERAHKTMAESVGETMTKIKCWKCQKEFEMPDDFVGRILCEDCDPFMSSVPSNWERIVGELTDFEDWLDELDIEKVIGGAKEE